MKFLAQQLQMFGLVQWTMLLRKQSVPMMGHKTLSLLLMGLGNNSDNGHTYLNGTVSATSVDTGKVIDMAVFSKFCKCPKTKSFPCLTNYKVSSGGMEVKGADDIFQHSLTLIICATPNTLVPVLLKRV